MGNNKKEGWMEIAIIKASLYARHCVRVFLFNFVINYLINQLLC